MGEGGRRGGAKAALGTALSADRPTEQGPVGKFGSSGACAPGDSTVALQTANADKSRKKR